MSEVIVFGVLFILGGMLLALLYLAFNIIVSFFKDAQSAKRYERYKKQLEEINRNKNYKI